MTSEYLIIGDVHGCLRELQQLIYTYGKDRKLVFVGDLLDKGPESVACVELAMTLGAVCVRGNHEDVHIRYRHHSLYEQQTGKKNPMKRPQEFQALNKALTESHLPVFGWLEVAPWYLHIAEHNIYVVHGGLLPGHSPASMDPKQLCRVRQIKPNGKMASLAECVAHPEYPFWTQLYEGYNNVVYGHAPFLKPRIDIVSGGNGCTYGIDTGCVYGNKLSGLLLPEFEVVSVPALDTYCERSWDD